LNSGHTVAAAHFFLEIEVLLEDELHLLRRPHLPLRLGGNTVEESTNTALGLLDITRLALNLGSEGTSEFRLLIDVDHPDIETLGVSGEELLKEHARAVRAAVLTLELELSELDEDRSVVLGVKLLNGLTKDLASIVHTAVLEQHGAPGVPDLDGVIVEVSTPALSSSGVRLISAIDLVGHIVDTSQLELHSERVIELLSTLNDIVDRIDGAVDVLERDHRRPDVPALLCLMDGDGLESTLSDVTSLGDVALAELISHVLNPDVRVVGITDAAHLMLLSRLGLGLIHDGALGALDITLKTLLGSLARELISLFVAVHGDRLLLFLLVVFGLGGREHEGREERGSGLDLSIDSLALGSSSDHLGDGSLLLSELILRCAVVLILVILVIVVLLRIVGNISVILERVSVSTTLGSDLVKLLEERCSQTKRDLLCCLVDTKHDSLDLVTNDVIATVVDVLVITALGLVRQTAKSAVLESNEDTEVSDLVNSTLDNHARLEHVHHAEVGRAHGRALGSELNGSSLRLDAEHTNREELARLVEGRSIGDE